MVAEQTFGQALRCLRSARDLTQAQLAKRAFIHPAHVSDLERGRRHPSRDVAAALDQALDAGGGLAALAQQHLDLVRVAPVTAGCVGAPAPLTPGDVEGLRDTVGHLVALDTAHGSDRVFPLAADAFAVAAARLAVTPDAGSDAYALVAELGEVASWCAFDAQDYVAARRLANEALLPARLAGDAAMETFLLAHLAMVATHAGRPAEALQIARTFGEGAHGRVAAMFAVRAARALAELGDAAGSAREMAAARSHLQDTVPDDAPPWLWWLSGPELDIHASIAAATTGDGSAAVEFGLGALERLPARQVRDQRIFRALVARSAAVAGAWPEVERLLIELQGAPRSVRLTKILREVADLVGAARPVAPPSVVEAAAGR